jgi:GNAT superfamily N-acetyltransferase
MQGSESVEFPIDGTLDLHTFQPGDVKTLVPDYLAACRERGILEVRIIHGKGTGALLRTVHSVLERIPYVVSFRLGDETAGGWGATLVLLEREKEISLSMVIREYEEGRDREGLRECVIALQEYERSLDSRLPEGASVADACLRSIFEHCRKSLGKIFVAEADGRVVGYVSVLARVRTDEPEEGPREHALVADVAVLEEYRRRGVGRRLLAAAEEYARKSSAKWMRVCVMAGNKPARALYAHVGFSERELDLEKGLE